MTRLVYMEDLRDGMAVEVARRTQTDVMLLGGAVGSEWATVLEVRGRAGAVSIRLMGDDGEQVAMYGSEIQLVRVRVDVGAPLSLDAPT